jgi:cytochrome c553
LAQAVTACARCHGAEDQGPVSRYVPLLHGQRADYLLGSMQAYAAGRRGSGIMQPVASDLPSDATRRVVEYYAALAPPQRQQEEADAGAVARGATLAAEGAPARQVPPCLPCHGDTALPAYPRLAGQSAAYAAGQLRLWKDGFTRGTPGDSIMAVIARRMSPQEVEDAAAYFESLNR